MEAFNRVLEDKLYVIPSWNTKSVVDKYPTNILDIDFENKLFKSNSVWFTENETVILEDRSYYVEHDETNTCIDIKISIR